MRGNELLEKMELADPAFIEEADAAYVRGRKRPVRWLAAAACMVLLIGSIAVAAATGYGTKIIELFTAGKGSGTHSDESGYNLSVDIVKISQEALEGNIREVPALIREQFENYDPVMSWYPGDWMKKFGSRNDACDYIGYEGLARVSWDLEEGETTLHVYGESDGKLLSVQVETPYSAGDMRLQFFTNLYTENTKEDITTGTFTTEYMEFTESYTTTAGGLNLHVIETTPLASGYMGTDGYLVKDGILYHLHIAHREKETEQAKALLCQWADLF